MMMKSMTRIIAAGVVVFVAGCEVPAPTTDTTTPEITVIVSGGRGGNIFRSIDGELDAPDNCIKVPDTPTQLVMIVGDSGGVKFASIKAFSGPIVPGSVELIPRPPEASSRIRTERGGADNLDITLTPPAPGRVRVLATAVFEVDGGLPIGIRASAREYAGNEALLPLFSLEPRIAAQECRGDG